MDDDPKPRSLHPDVLKRVEDALDHVIDTVFADDPRGFETDAQRRQFYFTHQKRSRRRGGQPQPCMFPGCSELSIKRSHTLPRSGPLDAIAEDGHVIAPTFSHSIEGVRAERVGIREASTFPGFCERHELEFASFEQAKTISAERDFLLQFYRIVCRELHVRRTDRDHMARSISAHEQVLSDRGAKVYREFLGDDFIRLHKLDPRKIRFEGKWMEAARKHLRSLEELCVFYESVFLRPLRGAIAGADVSDIAMVTMVLPRQVPMSLAGRGNFVVEAKGTSREVIAWLQVWPTQAETQVAIMGTLSDRETIVDYVKSFDRRPLGAVAMIERWMVHGTDHWYMRPSAWNRIPIARQGAILNDIMDTSKNIGFEYQWSIFDELRREAIANARAIAPPPDGVEDYVAFEEAKMATDGIEVRKHPLSLL
jgi:hypothetical protein